MSIAPKPVYAMVDLATKQGSHSEAEFGSTSDLSSIHNYEDVENVKPPVHPTTAEEASTPSVTRHAVESSYTIISKETLLSPDVTRYEYTNITSKNPTDGPKQGSTSLQKIHAAVIFLSLSFVLLFIGTCAGFTFITFKILEMKSQQLDSTPNNSRLMQTISELSANQSMLSDQYCTVNDCMAINQTLGYSLRELSATGANFAAPGTTL